MVREVAAIDDEAARLDLQRAACGQAGDQLRQGVSAGNVERVVEVAVLDELAVFIFEVEDPMTVNLDAYGARPGGR